jgi:hypothetical protein
MFTSLEHPQLFYICAASFSNDFLVNSCRISLPSSTQSKKLFLVITKHRRLCITLDAFVTLLTFLSPTSLSSSLTYMSLTARCPVSFHQDKVKFTLYQAPKAQRGSGGTALLIHDFGARRDWVVSTMLRSLYPQKRPSTHCTGGWVSPRTSLDMCEKSHLHWDSIPGPSSL